MAIKTYLENGKKLYEVYINGFDSAWRRIQRRKGGLETLRKAETTEFELKRELAKLKEQAVPFRWEEWFEKCIQTMKMVHAPSTIWNYNKQLRKWIHPEWAKREIDTIQKTDVYKIIFETIDSKISLHTRKNIRYWLLLRSISYCEKVKSRVIGCTPCGLQPYQRGCDQVNCSHSGGRTLILMAAPLQSPNNGRAKTARVRRKRRKTAWYRFPRIFWSI